MKTYTIVSDPDGLDDTYLRKILDKDGWKSIELEEQVKRENPHADLVWINADMVKQDAWKIKCLCKNLLGNDKIVITNKCNLYENMTNYYPDITKKHIPVTKYLHNFELQKGKVYIVRPCGRSFYSGAGIYVVTNQDELRKVKQIYNKKFIDEKKTHFKKTGQYFDVIVSEYISNPLLFNGLKFHLRMYLLVNIFPKYSHKLWEIGKIITAKKKYEPTKYDDKEIHDTHMKHTAKNMFFPKHLVGIDTDHIMKQMVTISDAIAKIFEKHAKPYPESKTAFEVYGLDFMVDSTLNVFLIELNDRVGYAPALGVRDKEFKQFNKKYFKWVFADAIHPIMENIK